MKGPTVFISYSHKDHDLKDRLVAELSSDKYSWHLKVWDDSQIATGEDWYRRIDRSIGEASVGVLLVSQSLLESVFITSEEVPRLMRQRDERGLWIFPVIIRECAWKDVEWLRAIQVHPRDGRPLERMLPDELEMELVAIAKEVSLVAHRGSQQSEATSWPPLSGERLSTSALPMTGAHFFDRRFEQGLLDGAWADESTNVISLVAWGGVGKTALVKKWQSSMGKDHYRGAQKVYCWSFHSQGTRDQETSAERFIQRALQWFGDENPGGGKPWEKGVRLAKLVRRERVLLILDGLEPLQKPPGPEEGRIKDAAVAVLVRELANYNPGLCVITSRHQVADIVATRNTTAPIIELENLAPADGARLLDALGVGGSSEERQEVSSEFGGHSLTLRLLGTFLRDVYGGEVGRYKEVSLLEADDELGGPAHRVLASYERRLTEPERAVLSMIGLFDKPAESRLIEVLREPPPITGLTGSLIGMKESRWRHILARLRRAELLAPANPHDPDSLDAHPLVREYFGTKLRRSARNAWREGHNRLYEHLKRTTAELPETFEEMEPLYIAMVHGCHAERHEDVIEKVYWPRIARKGEGFSFRKLGAFGSDLAALSHLLEGEVPAKQVPAKWRPRVLIWIASRLRVVGRLHDAMKPGRLALAVAKKQRDWRSAASQAGNMCEFCVTHGDLDEAIRFGEESVELTKALSVGSMEERCEQALLRCGNLASLGNAFHQRGKLEAASEAFERAGVLDVESQFSEEHLVDYFFYCDLAKAFFLDFLVTRGEIDRVVEVSRQTIAADKPYTGLVHRALAHLLLGKAHLIQAGTGRNGLDEVASLLDRAVKDLREAGNEEFLTWGLLTRAALRREQREFRGAKNDIDEAHGIASRGRMRLRRADCYLEYSELFLTQEDRRSALLRLNDSLEIVKATNYQKVKHRVEELRNRLGSG